MTIDAGWIVAICSLTLNAVFAGSLIPIQKALLRIEQAQQEQGENLARHDERIKSLHREINENKERRP